MSSSRTLSRKRRTSFTCIKPRFGPSIILLYIAASVEQYCDITQLNALPENEGILEGAAYTVFAHGEIESFIEDWAIAILDRAAQQWASGVTSRVLVHLLTFREASSLPDKLPSKNIWSAPCVEAIANHRSLIKRNN